MAISMLTQIPILIILNQATLNISKMEDYYSTDLNSPRNNMDAKSINKSGNLIHPGFM